MNRKLKYPVNRDEIVKALSEKRLSSYLAFPPYTDEKDSIFAYSYMQHLSICLFLPLHYLEITLRNRIYDVLVRHYRWRGKKYKVLGVPEDWLEWMPVNKITQKKISLVKSGLKILTITPNDLISNLSFGVWINILQEHPLQNSPYHFWLFTQKKLFPNAYGETRESICAELKEIRDIRNRLFHYEPIWNTDISNNNYRTAILEIIHKYKKIMNVIKWLSVDVFNFLKRRRNERDLAKQSLFYYRLFKGQHNYPYPLNVD